MVDGTNFWISCQRLPFLNNFSPLTIDLKFTVMDRTQHIFGAMEMIPIFFWEYATFALYQFWIPIIHKCDFLIFKKYYYRLRPIVKLKKKQLLATTKKWNWKFSNKKPGKIKPPWPVQKSKNIWQILFWPKNVKRPLLFPWVISKWYPLLETRPRPTTPSCGKRLQNPICWKWNMEKELGHTVSLRHIRGHLDYAINQLFLKMKSKADHFR